MKGHQDKMEEFVTTVETTVLYTKHNVIEGRMKAGIDKTRA